MRDGIATLAGAALGQKQIPVIPRETGGATRDTPRG